METEHFSFMGRTTTLAQTFNGYGIILIFVLLLNSMQLWLLATTPNRTMVLTLAVYLLITSCFEYIYFFPFAALFTMLAGITSLFAYYKLKVT